MTEKELKKLGRTELLEILISQMKENESLQVQLKNTEIQLQEANQQLEDRQICIFNAGSIAEAALHLNGVFEAAEAAGRQYLDNIKLLSERQQEICSQMEQEKQQEAASLVEATEVQCREKHEKTEQYCRELTEMTESKCRILTEETAKRCRELEASTTQKCAHMEQQAQEKSKAYWNDVSSRLEAFYAEHAGLRELLNVVSAKQEDNI